MKYTIRHKGTEYVCYDVLESIELIYKFKCFSDSVIVEIYKWLKEAKDSDFWRQEAVTIDVSKREQNAEKSKTEARCESTTLGVWHPYPEEKPSREDRYLVIAKYDDGLLHMTIHEYNEEREFGLYLHHKVVYWMNLPEIPDSLKKGE